MNMHIDMHLHECILDWLIGYTRAHFSLVNLRCINPLLNHNHTITIDKLVTHTSIG